MTDQKSCGKCQIYECEMADIQRQLDAFAILTENNPHLSTALLIQNLRQTLEKYRNRANDNVKNITDTLGKTGINQEVISNEKEDDDNNKPGGSSGNKPEVNQQQNPQKQQCPQPQNQENPPKEIQSNWDHVVTTFDEMNLDPQLLRGIYSYGYSYPSSIQQRVIIPCISGYDVIAQGKSETGRTAAVVIAVLQRIHRHNPHCQALILTLTTEAAQKIQGMVLSLGTYMGITCHSTRMYRDDNLNGTKGDRQIVVGTPADVHSLMIRKCIRRDSIRMVVIDDADLLLSGSFKFDVFNIMECLDQREVQLIRVSKTMKSEVFDGMRNFMRHPVTIVVKDIDDKNGRKLKGFYNYIGSKGVREFYVDVETEEWKLSSLSNLEMKFKQTLSQSLVFCNSTDKVDWLGKRMKEKKIQVATMHGDMDEKERAKILQSFASGAITMLITDYWFPGIDTSQQHPPPVLVNYDFPSSPRNYIQRIGFSRRFGGGGIAISFITRDDEMTFRDVQDVLGTEIEELPSDLIKYLQVASSG